jgi:hypothetical protein
MKKIVGTNALIAFLLVFISASCVNTPVILKPKVEGRYIKVKNNGREGDLNLLNITLIEEVNFGEVVCRFDVFGTTMSGKFYIDGDYVYIETGSEIGMLAMEIINSDTLEGEGWISGTFVKQKNAR